MKMRILFALLFALFMAKGISSLNAMQARQAALPPPERAALHIAALPLPAEKEGASPPVHPLPAAARACRAPSTPPARMQSAPPLVQSYYLARYQAFHYSDCAG